MSGGIFSPLGSCSELEKANCHPLVCLLCHEPYQHPCLLDCYHNFCASCLRGRASDGRLRCPLCGYGMDPAMGGQQDPHHCPCPARVSPSPSQSP